MYTLGLPQKKVGDFPNYNKGLILKNRFSMHKRSFLRFLKFVLISFEGNTQFLFTMKGHS